MQNETKKLLFAGKERVIVTFLKQTGNYIKAIRNGSVFNAPAYLFEPIPEKEPEQEQPKQLWGYPVSI